MQPILPRQRRAAAAQAPRVLCGAYSFPRADVYPQPNIWPFGPQENAMRTMFNRCLTWASALLLAASLTGCGYNDFQRLDEQSKSAWAEVLNQYQRRADLIPNIVATVKGEANFEQETLTRVIEARSKATSIQVTPEMVNDPAAMAKFQAAQGEVSSALSRLMVVVEQYPNLKANQGFSDLRVQLEGTENRITVARNRYIQAIQEYNVLQRSFPTNLTAMVFSYPVKASFQVENEAAISAPPKVDFNKP
jgi:LemA protein